MPSLPRSDISIFIGSLFSLCVCLSFPFLLLSSSFVNVTQSFPSSLSMSASLPPFVYFPPHSSFYPSVRYCIRIFPLFSIITSSFHFVFSHHVSSSSFNPLFYYFCLSLTLTVHLSLYLFWVVCISIYISIPLHVSVSSSSFHLFFSSFHFSTSQHSLAFCPSAPFLSCYYHSLPSSSS